MKSKLLFGAGIAAGYVLGSRSGRAAYDKLKARAAGIWDSKPVQDKVAAATEAVKEKAPEVGDQLSEAARRAGTVLSSAIHRDGAKSGDTAGPAGHRPAAGASGTDLRIAGTFPPTARTRRRSTSARPTSIPTRRGTIRQVRTGPTKAAPLRQEPPPTWTPSGNN